MPLLEVVWIALLGALSGLMIGCIGIGGVILVPALVFLAGIPIQIAIPAAMFAYILSGLVATAVFARNKSIDWRMASSLCIGGTPAAFAGAWAVSIFDGRLLAACLGVLTLLSGVNSLRPRLRAETDRATLSHGILFFVGAATGFLSSLTGTGGPLLLVPILLSMRLGVLASVGLSQIFQLPVAIAATAGNIVYGKLDLVLGIVLAASLSGGSWFGAKLAHAVPRATLRGIISGRLDHRWPLSFSPMSPGACSDSRRRWTRPTLLSIFVTVRDGRTARYSLTICGQQPSLRAAALDSLRSLRMWSTTAFLALLQYAIPAEFGGGVGRADRTC